MKDNKFRLGLVSVSFRQHSQKEILEAMKSAGLSYVEWGSDVHAPFNDIKRLKEIAEMQKEYGVICSSYGTYFRLGETPVEKLQNYIDGAKVLGTNILRLWCGSKSGADMTQSERERLFEQCRKAAKIAQKNDVILCMECHRATFTEHYRDTLTLMETVRSSHFQMYWQPFQWLNEEQNLEIAENIARYTGHIHVFNWKGSEKLPLALAVDTWKTYLSVLPPPRVLLLEFMPDGRIESLKNEADALRKIAGDSL